MEVCKALLLLLVALAAGTAAAADTFKAPRRLHEDAHKDAAALVPDCVCAGVVPNCDDAAMIASSVDVLLLNNCAVANACATNPTCRDAWYYLSAHRDLCGSDVLQLPVYQKAAEAFRLCPPCRAGGPVPACPAQADCADLPTADAAVDYLEHHKTVCMVDCEGRCLEAFHTLGSYHDCEGVFTREFDELYHHLEDVCVPCDGSGARRRRQLAGAAPDCSANNNMPWAGCGPIVVGEGRSLGVCAVAPEMVPDPSAEVPCPASISVNITNVTYRQSFSPLMVVFHSAKVSLFKSGGVASDAMRALAEDGNASGLLAIATNPAVSSFICAAIVADAPTEAGSEFYGAANIVYSDDCQCGYVVATVVGKLMSTNDGFVGVESAPVDFLSTFHVDHYHSPDATSLWAPAYDAGTERNTELCGDIPGAPCNDGANASIEEGSEGFVHVHRGLHGGGDLDSTYSWNDAVAKVYIKPSNRYLSEM